MNHIIGAGGVGSWLCPSLCLLRRPEEVTVIDGDRLELKNLNRQLFTQEQVGQFKSDALASRYGCRSIPEWYYAGLFEVDPRDWLICVVDNHPARKAALESCDFYKCCAIFAANETHSSEAYVYRPEWKGGPLDPRIYYPEINTDGRGDPRRAAIGCTGEAQEANRQLVSANFMAAALALHLYVVWAMEAPKLERESRKHLPFKIVNNLSKTETCSEHKLKGQDHGNTTTNTNDTTG